MYAVKVQAYFNAAHNLRGYRGKCEKLHGHNWKVEAELTAPHLNRLSMVSDFREIRKNLQKALTAMDHAYLNKIPYFRKNNPTSEKIAEFIYYNLKKLLKDKRLKLRQVTVWETQESSAAFCEEDA